jgi:(heptosyl)LPS beta-1,4-glucosyltransferase
MSVSAVLIVKNEEQRLRDCLCSLTWATEIIVLDSGSSDATVAIAKEYTDKVYVNKDWLGFGPQRQLAQEYATCDWVFAIDADEVVSLELAESIQQAAKPDNLDNVYSINRRNWAFGEFIDHSGWNPDWVVRLYPREKTSYCSSLVHESIVVGGLSLKRLEGRLWHYTYDSLYDYNRKVSGYLKSWADQREGQKKSSIVKGLGHGFFAFLRMYCFRLGFLDGRHGFILAFLTAYTTSLKYFDLWLRENQKKHDSK